MQLKSKLIITTIISTLLANTVFAEMVFDPVLQTDIIKIEPIKQSPNTLFKKNFKSAVDKFENLNIKISYDDFNRLISKNHKNDFYLLVLADKTAELGFFDLSKQAFSRIEDFDISNNVIENTKKFYFPKKSITKSDILILAELYSNIVYNDQAKESVVELGQYPRLLNDYDYANYLMALGYYKLNDLENAKQYIKTATEVNPENINYKILESQIFTGDKKGKISKKLIKEIDEQEINTKRLSEKLESSNEYVSYLLVKKPFDKDYYLGRYYYAEGNYVKASRIFMTALGKNKKNNALLYSMLARCAYALGDYKKAEEYCNKTNKITASNPDCMITMGDLAAKNGDYKNALKYYKSAESDKKLRQEALEKMASVYTKMSYPKRANDIYKRLIEDYNSSYIAYYKIGLITPEKELDYLKKSVSINPSYQDGWIDLARVMLDKGNISLAKSYLSVANYLDDSNFRYYYYQSLLNKKEAEMNSIKNSNDVLNKIAGRE